MTVRQMRKEIDSEEYEGWKKFYGEDQVGGLRGPDDEIQDVLIARLMSVIVNINKTKDPVSPRDYLIYQYPMTEAQREKKIGIAKAKMKSVFALLKKRPKTNG